MAKEHDQSTECVKDTANWPFRPALAAKQMVPPNATRSKLKSLKKKEKRLKRQVTRDINNLKQHHLKHVKFQVDPVLGNPSNGFIQRVREDISDQTNLAGGYTREEVEKLFYGVEKVTLSKIKGSNVLLESAVEAEQHKKTAVLTMLNMRNTNAKDKRLLAINRAKREFARVEGDTGSPEVQAAIMTVKIHLGMDHVKQFHKDKVHLQNVRELVQQRQSILRYLKKVRPEDYYYCLEKLGLTDDVITREFNMGRQYLQDYKVWGDKQLVKLSDKQKRKEQKFTELQKKVVSYNQLARANFDALN
ncbi:hypothetical protein CANTEDRAFT_131552 [Yamadazyma tenuis ATCC 10573]|uniref:Ribosomal protein S15 n=1 Tax=Candida tenuis (strain ATCC 10573 / BCRC 21748 / CBS 615 / JCM 9827 / NBRC 10315 / NRRL Y-1498 / VKM Y-70) TaxID=590646 RepID=G3BB40_CANTC|nr:uncharacterized protein CANTEDRAFT_131552 [Yamadazyma tenuis ATCC 10573]EGV62133.1 hypothetical protein CANTEDRAFT_131552 [Yamadazyma tenuis ATCC 10573]